MRTYRLHGIDRTLLPYRTILCHAVPEECVPAGTTVPHACPGLVLGADYVKGRVGTRTSWPVPAVGCGQHAASCSIGGTCGGVWVLAWVDGRVRGCLRLRLQGASALLHACLEGMLSTVQSLIAAHADVSAASAKARSPRL